MTQFRTALAVLLAAPIFGADTLPPKQGLVAHEWGTFTSVAGPHGAALNWLPLTGPSDLPCFVHSLGINLKGSSALERMETPVVYFYTQKKAVVSLRADLPSGTITEWYPQAASTPNTGRSGGTIEWNAELTPGPAPDFPMTKASDHYFAARETDAVPLRAAGEAEKMLFYRGIANFPSPLAAEFARDGHLEIRPKAGPKVEPVSFAMLFENRNGKVGYRIVRDIQVPQAIAMPELSSDPAGVQRELVQALTAAGLYPKEAAAMIATWRDSWFEEGMRVFYLTPRSVVDSVLPLHIAPAPEVVARVFVGRIELLPEYLKETLAAAVAATDKKALDRFGRFYFPFMDMTGVKATGTTQSYMNAKFSQALNEGGKSGCR
jgi:hypothetical protein